jgi:hypothetical protein
MHTAWSGCVRSFVALVHQPANHSLEPTFRGSAQTLGFIVSQYRHLGNIKQPTKKPLPLLFKLASVSPSFGARPAKVCQLLLCLINARQT